MNPYESPKTEPEPQPVSHLERCVSNGVCALVCTITMIATYSSTVKNLGMMVLMSISIGVSAMLCFDHWSAWKRGL